MRVSVGDFVGKSGTTLGTFRNVTLGTLAYRIQYSEDTSSVVSE